MYVRGRGGLAKDDTQAVAWYRRAAEQGFAAAQASLGAMYEQGRGGLAKDVAKAIELLTMASRSSDARIAQVARNQLARLQRTAPWHSRPMDDAASAVSGAPSEVAHLPDLNGFDYDPTINEDLGPLLPCMFNSCLDVHSDIPGGRAVALGGLKRRADEAEMQRDEAEAQRQRAERKADKAETQLEEEHQGRISTRDGFQYVHTFVLRNPTRLDQPGIPVEYLMDEGAGDTADGAVDIPYNVQQQLGILSTGRKTTFAMANGRPQSYQLVDVHVEYTQPNGQTRQATFTASSRRDLRGDRPLFGNYAKLQLRLTTGPPIA